MFGDLDIEVALDEQVRGAAVIVHDDIETGDHPCLRRRVVELIDSGYRDLVIDISEARRIHWAVVGTMIGLARRLDECAGRLGVFATDPYVVHLLRSLETQENITVLEDKAVCGQLPPLPQAAP